MTDQQIHVAFLMDCKDMSARDGRDVMNGNPCMGGTEYEFILVPLALTTWFPELKVTVYNTGKFILPDAVHNVYVDDRDKVPQLCRDENVDFLVLDARTPMPFFDLFKGQKTRLVVWAHCFCTNRMLAAFAANERVSSIVCVGREQMDQYVEHPAYEKSTAIYNAVPIVGCESPQGTQRKDVIYVGSLTPGKGFHILSKAWNDVLRQEPDAQLHVIGTGAVYCRERELGSYGLAHHDYESIFMPPLLDSEGNIIPSVHFHGNMGTEKFEMMKSCKVGVPNPGGISETFGISAVEMQMAGLAVTTIECPGYMDTVYNTKNLYKKTSQLAGKIVQLLREPSPEMPPLIEFLEKNFSPQNIAGQWFALFTALQNGERMPRPKMRNYGFDMKWLKVLNSHIRKIIPCWPTCYAVKHAMLSLLGKGKA